MKVIADRKAQPTQPRHRSGTFSSSTDAGRVIRLVVLLVVLVLAACQPVGVTPGAVQPPTATVQPAAAINPQLDHSELLAQAVNTLQNTPSFHLNARVITAYEGTDSDGERSSVYQEQIIDYAVIRQPVLKVHTCYQIRIDPQNEFTVTNTYAYLEGGKYYVIDVNEAGLASKNEVAFEQVEPLAGDVYQTLNRYATQAEFQTESGGTALYKLDHPAWYTLREAIRFAGMEALAGKPDSLQRLEEYAAETYPHAKTIQFLISVDVERQVISQVTVDDRDFLRSIWQAEGGDPTLAGAEILQPHGSVFLFDRYAQVENFEIPQVPT